LCSTALADIRNVEAKHGKALKKDLFTQRSIHGSACFAGNKVIKSGPRIKI
jgi:hypothetical protein